MDDGEMDRREAQREEARGEDGGDVSEDRYSTDGDSNTAPVPSTLRGITSPTSTSASVPIPRHMLLHKTRLCRDFMQTGKCQFLGLCSFAHGRHELRSAQEAARHASQQSLKQQEEVKRRAAELEQLKAAQGMLPVPIDPNLKNFTFSSRVVRVMASANYPDDAHFCIAESTPGNPDVFVSRKAIPEDVWKDLMDWWISSKNSHVPMVLQIECQMHKKGTNNFRAFDVKRDPLSLSACGNASAATGEDTYDGKADDPFARPPKNIDGDFAPKYGHTCKITSSGKNFSFADDCIFIRNELRDACGIKGLWVGDVVIVDATFNHLRRNWVASSVALVRRNNTGYNMMQDAIIKMQEELLQTAGLPIPSVQAESDGVADEAAKPVSAATSIAVGGLHAGAGADGTEEMPAATAALTDETARGALESAVDALRAAGEDEVGSAAVTAPSAVDEGEHGAAAAVEDAPGNSGGDSGSSAADVVASLVKGNPLLSALTGSGGNSQDLSLVLRDPNVLQTLISALQQQRAQQQRSVVAAGDLERQEQANAQNLAENGSGSDAAQLAISREERMKFNFRTEMCGNFLKHGHCRYGNKCMFAHSKQELRTVGSPLPPAEAAIADQIAAAILHTQSRTDDGGAGGAGKRSIRPGAADLDADDTDRGKRARAHSGGAAAAAAAAPAWVGALEKYSEEELCSGELFVCGLDRRVRTSEDLRAIFAVYGPVKDARMIQQSGVKAGARRQVSKGYGFVLFQDTRDNLKAVTALDGSRNAHGRRIKVMPAESSGTSAAVHEEERSLEDALAAALVQEDYLDPQAVGGDGQAPGAAGNALEGSVFEEEHLMLQSAEQGNMRVCMMQV